MHIDTYHILDLNLTVKAKSDSEEDGLIFFLQKTKNKQDTLIILNEQSKTIDYEIANSTTALLIIDKDENVFEIIDMVNNLNKKYVFFINIMFNMFDKHFLYKYFNYYKKKCLFLNIFDEFDVKIDKNLV